MSDPRVSVVVPTYNAPGLLAETLATVFAQTWADFELIVVDDGSTEETGRLLASIADPRLRVIRQENAGIGAARNRGIDEARGQYVALLDHDDLWKPGKLAAQVAFMEAHPSCAACTVPWATSDRPEACGFDVAAIAGGDRIVKRPLRVLARGAVFLISSSILFDRARAAGLRYETRRQCIEDTPFQIGLFARGEFGVAGEGEDVLMVYRVHGSNYSSQASFFYNGQRMLRELDSRGAFAAFAGPAREDLREFLGHVGRTGAVRQLLGGYRGRGFGLYLSEAAEQARLGRWKFLAMFPAMGLMPRAWLQRRYGDTVV